jgi:hypothetical protein
MNTLRSNAQVSSTSVQSQKRHLHLWTIPCGLVALGALGACGAQGMDSLESEEPVAETSDELYARSSRIWLTLEIPVCWENPSPSNATERDWVARPTHQDHAHGLYRQARAVALGHQRGE